MKLGQIVKTDIDGEMIIGRITGMVSGNVISIKELSTGNIINTVGKIVQIVGWLQRILLFIQDFLKSKKE